MSKRLGLRKARKPNVAGASLGDASKERRENIEITQRKRSEQPGENVEITQRKRRDNVEITKLNTKERREQPGENVEKTQRKRSEQPGENVEIELLTMGADPNLLVGTQRKVFSYLVEVAQNFASLATPPLTLDLLSASTGLRSSQIHTATKELRKKKLLVVNKRKDGRGGWISYRVESQAYDKWVRLSIGHKRRENVEKTQRKRSEQPGDKPGDDPSSSSSGLNFKSTITSDEMWKTLDLSVIEKMGVNHAAIFEARQKFGPFNFVDLEVLIDRFTKYVLDPKSGKKISNPRAFFFGLCKQMSTGIEPLSEVQTEADKALEEYLLKAKADKTAREERDREIITFEFENWFQGLSDEERCAIIPPTGLVKEDTPPYLAMFRDYFERTLWPEKKQRIEKGEV